MPKSTRSFKETILVDYCYRRDGIVTTNNQGNVPNEKWKLTYSNGEVLSPSFGYFLDDELITGDITFFVLDDSDEKWIRETMKLSGEQKELSERVEELKPVLKSLTDFVKFRENKRIYIREVCITSEKPSEKRRIFTEEALEIIPIILKQQNSNIEKWEDLLQKYRLEWKREHVYYSINMETFNSVLEEFNINKGLITVVPDPIYEMSEEDMLEFGSEVTMRLSPHGTWLLDSSHAIFFIFQSVVWGVNWKSGDSCKDHKNCKIGMKRMIMKGALTPTACIDNTIDCLRNQCDDTWESKGIGFDVTAFIAIDTRPHSDSLYYHVYQQEMLFYELPNYASALHKNASFNPQTDCISVWMARVLLLIGWAQQFFDKESVDLANVVLGLIFKKAPVKSKDAIVLLLKTVQASVSGIDFTSPSEVQRLLIATTNVLGPVSESHQKMLRKAQERAQKLRKRKEQAKPNKAKKPSSTNVVTPTRETVEAELFETSFLEKLKYVEPKLKIAKRDVKNRYSSEPIASCVKCNPNCKDQEFGNIPNVFSGTVALETSSSEPLSKEVAVMKEDEDRRLKVGNDFCTVDEFQKEEEDVTATEVKEDLEVEDVMTLETEVEKLKENGEKVDELQEELTEQMNKLQLKPFNEETQRANESENQLKEMIVILKMRLNDAEKVINVKDDIIKLLQEKCTGLSLFSDNKSKFIALKLKDLEQERDLDKKKMEEEKKKLKSCLEEKTKKVVEVEKKIMEITSKLNASEEKRDWGIKEMEEEKKKLKCSLDQKTRKVDDVENKLKLRDSEIHQLKSKLGEMKKQSENQEKLLKEKGTVIERFKVEAEKSKSEISEKEKENVILKNQQSKSAETNQTLIVQLSRMEEELRMLKLEEQENNSMILKANEQLQTTNSYLSIQNEEQQKTIQNLYGRLAMVPSPAVSGQEEKKESVQSQISTIRNLLDKLSNSEDSKEARQFRITLQSLRNIKDRFQNKEQLKLARTMTDKLITMSNRSEIRELALYEYQQYEANFQNYTQLVDLNIEKMKETRDCSLYSPLPKPPAFSDRFMNEYWLECDNDKEKKKELEMDISDSECLICFFEMNSDQKTLKCDHCKKITHLKCASKWLQIHRSCPHCRREQLDPDEFPALS
ncbi:hypothetical protein B9Z55_009235 [Caenorhabditis nigoni]|uniref:RING-type domain-containing protein n=1 Tax=Caenorhabditis nigoni TaxID=1611254 RepID=A0A2G5US01_9PELO|nr:hypothetical protein B9Z55_009235 [Caenorhabditis nigoni]